MLKMHKRSQKMLVEKYRKMRVATIQRRKQEKLRYESRRQLLEWADKMRALDFGVFSSSRGTGGQFGGNWGPPSYDCQLHTGEMKDCLEFGRLRCHYEPKIGAFVSSEPGEICVKVSSFARWAKAFFLALSVKGAAVEMLSVVRRVYVESLAWLSVLLEVPEDMESELEGLPENICWLEDKFEWGGWERGLEFNVMTVRCYRFHKNVAVDMKKWGDKVEGAVDWLNDREDKGAEEMG
jgi:hypothetical protein